MSDPILIDREPVELPELAGLDSDIWPALIELTQLRQPKWTLIGGQMVLLHALEHQVPPPRVSTDLDALVNARATTHAVRSFVEALTHSGFELTGVSPDDVAHRYVRNGVGIDVLAPEGLGARADLTTTPPWRTLEVPGGTQALARTELLPVRFGDLSGHVPRPSLLGAIICKAAAVTVDDLPDAQRADLALLLSLVKRPLETASEMTNKERSRLCNRREMDDSDHPAWLTLDNDAASRGLSTYRILTRQR